MRREPKPDPVPPPKAWNIRKPWEEEREEGEMKGRKEGRKGGNEKKREGG